MDFAGSWLAGLLADLLTFASIAAFVCGACDGPGARGAAWPCVAIPRPDFEIPRGTDKPVRAGVSRKPHTCRGATSVSHRGAAAALRGRYRDADPHLHHARLGAECRGRARRAARFGLRRLLRGGRLHLCADLHAFRLVVLGLPAARRLLRGTLGHHARFPGVAFGATTSPS